MIEINHFDRPPAPKEKKKWGGLCMLDYSSPKTAIGQIIV